MGQENSKIVLHFIISDLENLFEKDVNATIVITKENDSEIYGYISSLPPEKLSKLLVDLKL